MLDISWSEMAVVALVALVILGPKELPGALRAITQVMGRIRSLAREFQRGVDDIIRESEVAEARNAIKDVEQGLRREVLEGEGQSIAPQKSAMKPSDVTAPGSDSEPAVTGASEVDNSSPTSSPSPEVPKGRHA